MVLYEIMEVLGKPSKDWWLRWGNAAAGMKITQGTLVYKDGPENLDKMMDELDETIDKEPLRDMLKQMLTLKPEERLSIKEVQKHVWLRSLI